MKIKINKKFKSFFLTYFIIFISFIITIKTFSKYAGQVQGNGNKSIAKWDVSLDTSNNSDSIDIIAGNTTQTYNLEITSLSEVGLNYNVIISNLPDTIRVSLDGGEYQAPEDNVITFENAGSFNANDLNAVHNHTLTFAAQVKTDVIENKKINIDLFFIQKEV